MVLDGATVHMAWLGKHIGIVARGGGRVAETTPHGLHERVRQEEPGVDLSNIPNCITRALSQDEHLPADYLTTEAIPGDTILLVSLAGPPEPAMPHEEIAFVAAAYSNPQVLAERVAAAA